MLILAWIASRLKPVLKHVINEKQKGFLKGNLSGEILVLCIIEESNIKQLQGVHVHLLIDF